MSNPRVFEFAKEIGMTPLALMDKIKEWQIPVKSHMAELDAATLAVLKQKLEAKAEVASEAPKKTTVRKKATAEKAEAPSAKSSTVKGAAVKSTAVKSTAVKKKAAAAPEPTEEPAAVAKTSPTVVRRKKADMVVEAPVVEPEPVVAPVVVAPEIKKPEVAKLVETPAPQAAVAAPQVAAPVVEEEKKPVAPAAAGPARKKEVAIGNSGVASAAPRRNIIGRMDLSRMQNPTGAPAGGGTNQRFQGGGSSAQPARYGVTPGAGGPPRPRSHLRSGFVQQAAPAIAPALPPFSNEFERRKDDRNKKAKLGAEGAAAAAKPAEEGALVPFDAAEFRKREMVFQPKKKKGMLNRPSLQTQITTPKAAKRILKINNTIKVSDLAAEMGVKATDLIKVLMKNGSMASMNTDLDFDTVALIVPDFGFEAVNAFRTAEAVVVETAFGELEAERIVRPPVVTVMGHVDHGKTSLLDAIRNADVASGEAGGITQHIGAYQVKLESGDLVTFLDTPGHEAFTSMRARGANVTDIVIIVVAADDGVMPQTAEAVNHAKAAGVPIIVAVNKMDKPGANPDRVKQQLTEFEIVPEEWGGSTIFCNVSAMQKTGIKELLEQVLLVAEVGEFKANPKRSGTGVVIEARLEKGRGPVATFLVQDGTISVGQDIVAGAMVGRVKSITNDRGERILSAGPGMPVEVLGLEAVPLAGDKFDVVKDDKAAKEVAEIRRTIIDKAKQSSSKMTLDQIFAKVSRGDVKELSVVLKVDVAGSLEAIIGMFAKLASLEVKLKVIHSGIGGINESDVLLASTAKGIVVGFGVRPDSGAANEAKRLGVEVRTYSIVYELMDEMKKAMTGLLTPDIVEKVIGRLEVRNTFSVPKLGTIAGCSVTSGKIQRSNMVRLVRDGKIVFEGKLASLKRFKDDAKEVVEGFECGVGIEGFNDIKVGDALEAVIKEEIARSLTPMTQPSP